MIQVFILFLAQLYQKSYEVQSLLDIIVLAKAGRCGHSFIPLKWNFYWHSFLSSREVWHMFYCQKYNFQEYKPHPHTQHFASTESWCVLGEPGLSRDFKHQINTEGIFISWWQRQTLNLTGFFCSDNTA